MAGGRKFVTLLLALMAGMPAVVAPAATSLPVMAPRARIANTTYHDAHWAGYAAVGKTNYTSGWANWTQPSVQCPDMTHRYSSFWVGMDTNDADGAPLEQTGTAAECVNGKPSYYGWLELVLSPTGPYPPEKLPGAVRPGDKMKAAVWNKGGGNYQTQLFNLTLGWTYTRNMFAGAGSAQAGRVSVIAEDPANGATGAPLPLAHFSDVTFTSVTANNVAFGKQGYASYNVVQNNKEMIGVSSLYGYNSFVAGWKCC